MYSTDFELSQDDINFMQAFNEFQLEGRYPDHHFSLNKICTKEYTLDILNNVKKIIEWFLEKV